MGDATRPLRAFEPFINAMRDMEKRSWELSLELFLTAVVQSSAATLAGAIALAGQGLTPLEAGIALVLDANVGTVGTTLLATICKSAKRLKLRSFISCSTF